MPPAKKTTKTEGPKYSELIKAALLGLKERNGSSLAAIKKYMASNFPAAKVRLTRRRATCRITYLHLLPGFPRVPLRLPTPHLLLIPSPSPAPPALPSSHPPLPRRRPPARTRRATLTRRARASVRRTTWRSRTRSSSASPRACSSRSRLPSSSHPRPRSAPAPPGPDPPGPGSRLPVARAVVGAVARMRLPTAPPSPPCAPRHTISAAVAGARR